MTSRELIYIKTIAEQKSISKAAEVLYVSQPSLSQFLARIEKELGVKLFSRTSSGLMPTYAGEKYISAANNILKIYSDFENEVNGVSNLEKGRVKIGITYFLSKHILPMILPKFNKEHPGIELYIIEKSSTELEKLLSAGELDLAIMHTHRRLTASNGITEHTLLVTDPFVAVSQELKGKKYIDIEDISDIPFIMVHKDQRIRQITDYILHTRNVTPSIILTTRNCETAKCLCENGMGVCLIPKYYTEIFDNRPSEYPIVNHPDSYWTLSIMVQNGEYISEATNKIIEMLRDIYN